MGKIAICGYSSNVGKVFIERYSGEYEIVKIGRREDSDIKVDLRDCSMSGNVDRLYGCDALVNLTAQTDDSTDEVVLDLIRTNVVGAVFLAEQVKRYNIGMFVNMSSVSALYDDTDPYYSYYAESKKTADAFLRHYCKINNVKLCILRPSSIFGRKSFAEHQKLFYGLAEKVKNGEDVYIYGSNDALRNYVHVNTVCDVIVEVIRKEIGGVYLIANKSNCRLSELVRELDIFLGKTTRVSFLHEESDINDCRIESDDSVYLALGLFAPDEIGSEIRKGIW